MRLLTTNDLSALSTSLRQCKPLTLERIFEDHKVLATVCPASPAWPVAMLAMLVRVEMWWPGWYMSKYCESVEEAQVILEKIGGYSMECVSNTMKNGTFCCRTTRYQTCQGETCPFFKDARAAAEAGRKTDERLNSLPREEQRCIADKYYGGEMPWKE